MNAHLHEIGPNYWADLMKRVAEDQDQSAFQAIFEYFAPRVKAFLIKSGLDAAQAEECSQDVMATVWRKSQLFDGSRAALSTWIFTIARNRRIDLLRKVKHLEPEDLHWGPDQEPDQEDVYAVQEMQNQLDAAIKGLPEKQRQLVERVYFGELSHAEVSVETGLPLGTIKSRLRLALEKLRRALK